MQLAAWGILRGVTYPPHHQLHHQPDFILRQRPPFSIRCHFCHNHIRLTSQYAAQGDGDDSLIDGNTTAKNLLHLG
jgi:hypothetical protein